MKPINDPRMTPREIGITIISALYIVATLLTIGIGAYVPEEHITTVQALLIMEFPAALTLMLGVILTIPTARKDGTHS